MRMPHSPSSRAGHAWLVTLLLSAACGGSANSKPAATGGAGAAEDGSGQASRAGRAAAASGGRAASAPKDAGTTEPSDAAAPADAAAPSGGSAGHADAPVSGSSGSPAPVDAGAPLDRGPYFSSGAWHGYFWTAEHGQGTTLTSTNFTRATFDAPICLKGSVAASPDNAANAMLGVNLNQLQTPEMYVQTIAPSRDGVQLNVTNSAGSPLRLQVQALDGDTNADARWCATVNGAGGFIPWTQFNTACWDGSGKPYQRQPISGAMLLVPGATDAAVRFDFCLNALSEASAPEADAGID